MTDRYIAGSNVELNINFETPYKHIMCDGCVLSFDNNSGDNEHIETLVINRGTINPMEAWEFPIVKRLKTLEITGHTITKLTLIDILGFRLLQTLILTECYIFYTRYNMPHLLPLETLTFRECQFNKEYLELSIPLSLKKLDFSGSNLSGISIDGDNDILEIIDFTDCKNLQLDMITFSENIPYSIVRWPSHISGHPTKEYINVKGLMLDMFSITEFSPIAPWKLPKFVTSKNLFVPNPICVADVNYEACYIKDVHQIRRKDINLAIQYDRYPLENSISQEDALARMSAIIPTVEWSKSQLQYVTNLDVESKYIIELYSHTGDRVMNSYLRRQGQGVLDMLTYNSATNSGVSHVYKLLLRIHGITNVTFNDIKSLQPYIVERLQKVILEAPPVDREIVVYRATDALRGIYNDSAFISTSFLPTKIEGFITTDKDEFNGIYVIKIPQGSRCLFVSETQYTNEFEILLPHGSTFSNDVTYGFISKGVHSLLSKATLLPRV